MKRPSVITVADEKVPIVTVCRMLGLELPDEVGNRKVHCPFGELYHSDQGVAPAMRIYPETNSAFCFSCSTAYTPVRLAARGWDVTRQTAAVRLLDVIGHRPLDMAARWQRVTEYAPEVDRALLAEALKTYCRRVEPSWSTRQFDADVAASLTRCLALVSLVHTADDVQQWLTGCKTVMTQVLLR